MSNNDNVEPVDPLTEWLASRPNSDFPPHGGIPYLRRFMNVAGLMNSQVHPHIGQGASLADGGLLTDHGPNHIDTVVRRAASLLSYPEDTFPQISPYEMYVLLLAIHFHDVGNIFGRDKHEKRHIEVIGQFDQFIGNETVERRAIQKIAEAHGGRIAGSKDTISTLHSEALVLGQKIRYRALAAILRFSDELADDSHRASRIGDMLGTIPPESEVFHAYAKCLHSVSIEPDKHVIYLQYAFFQEDATKTFGKGKRGGEVEHVYLLDEIYERTLKMHLERKYCMRFLQGIVRIDAIEVLIEVFQDGNSLTPCLDPIGYRLEEQGYPEVDAKRVRDICPHITMDGATLKRRLTTSTEQ